MSIESNIPEKLSSKHEIEAISLVKEEAADPEGDDDKQTNTSIWIVFPVYAVYYAWYVRHWEGGWISVKPILQLFLTCHN